MQVQFSWHVEDEDECWETAAAPARREWARSLRWVGLGVALVLLFAGSGYVAVSHYERTSLQRSTFHIQSVIDLEAQTLARGDIERYLAQQDQAAPGWMSAQAERARGYGRQASPDVPDLSAKVQRVELWGDAAAGGVAWVEVAVGQERLRQVRFYRQTALGWVHTVPHAGFWGDPVEWTDGGVTVHAHERDRPYVQPLVEAAKQALEDLCAGPICPPDRALELRIVLAAGRAPGHLGDAIVLPSPWLSGIPATGVWDPSVLHEVRYWAAYLAARKAVDPSLHDDLSARQRAILVEYAARYAAQDPSAASILPRIVAQHGAAHAPLPTA